MAINLLNLGSVARATGDLAAAGQHYRASLALGREIGRGLIVAAALDGLGQTHLLAGDLEAAWAALREGLATAVDINSTNMILTLLASLGRGLLQAGQPEGARLLAAVWQQPGAAHYLKEEVAAFAAETGLDLTAVASVPLTTAEAVTLAISLF
jgi:hypothetical protein